MSRCIVTTPKEDRNASFDWGELAWFCSKEQENSQTLTVGRCTLKPGAANPRHYHPNCDEVLYVLEGKILHSMENGRTVEMNTGDTISIPKGVPHNAKNIGDGKAVLMICFSSADRQTIGE
jgi:quercetin dioxygenase-like cupin family protein